MRMNWRDVEVFLNIDGPCGMRDAARVGMLAFALRTPFRVWWHVGRNQMKLALLDAPNEAHFRSFAELGLCGCAPRPDGLGLISRLANFMLRRVGSEHPIDVDFSEKPEGGKVSWGDVKILK